MPKFTKKHQLSRPYRAGRKPPQLPLSRLISRRHFANSQRRLVRLPPAPSAMFVRFWKGYRIKLMLIATGRGRSVLARAGSSPLFNRSGILPFLSEHP
jgi:hypothetical protein